MKKTIEQASISQPNDDQPGDSDSAEPGKSLPAVIATPRCGGNYPIRSLNNLIASECRIQPRNPSIYDIYGGNLPHCASSD